MAAALEIFGQLNSWAWVISPVVSHISATEKSITQFDNTVHILQQILQIKGHLLKDFFFSDVNQTDQMNSLSCQSWVKNKWRESVS